jgi:hypothetical protein
MQIMGAMQKCRASSLHDELNQISDLSGKLPGAVATGEGDAAFFAIAACIFGLPRPRYGSDFSKYLLLRDSIWSGHLTDVST